MSKYSYRNFKLNDILEIDNIFKKSMRSIKPSLLKCNNICYIWSYKFITIIFGMNIIYPIIDYLYLILLYFLFIIMFYTCSRIYIEYYIYTTLPGRDISIYYKKENTIIVAIDKNNKPSKIPKLKPVTKDEKRRYERAKERHLKRRKNRIK